MIMNFIQVQVNANRHHGLMPLLRHQDGSTLLLAPSYALASLLPCLRRYFSYNQEARIEEPRVAKRMMQTTPGGMCTSLPRINLMPMKTRIAATPYLRNWKSWTSSSTMKNIARRPSIAKTAEVYAKKRSGTWATIALTESTANRISLISKQITTRKSIVARVWVLTPGCAVRMAAKSTDPYPCSGSSELLPAGRGSPETSGCCVS